MSRMIVCSGPNCQTTAGCQCQGAFARFRVESDRPVRVVKIETAQSRAYEAGRLAGLREAAEVARGCQTFDWEGGEEWAAGYVDGKNAAAEAILALAERGEG